MPAVRPCVVLAAASLLTPSPAPASVTEWQPRGFTIELEVLVPGSPEVVWDAFTGDVSGWWDHSFSGNPAVFVIEPWPGGGFWEYYDDNSRDGVKHAEVLFAKRAERLTMHGPLGFNGKALDFVFTLRFAAERDSTRIHFEANGSGQVEDGWPETIEDVWKHFLIEQFKAWVEAGEHLDRASPGSDQ